MSDTSIGRGSNRLLIIGVIVVLIVAGVVAYSFMPNSAAPNPAASKSQPAAAVKDIYRLEGKTYVADFTSSVGPQFSDGTITTVKGDRKLLGPFKEMGVGFKLTGLPAHQAIHLTFDLALIKSWNGSNRQYGPDAWICAINNGPTLLSTTFSNCGFFNDNNQQSYPDVFPASVRARPHPAWTGAAENQTLGFPQTWSPTQTFDCSGVYHLDWTFPHSEPVIELTFSSEQRLKHDKLFGLLSFKLEPVETLASLTNDEMNQAWLDLGKSDAVAANSAVWKLISAGDQAATFISTRLGPTLTIPSELSDPYSASRVKHILEVINSATANQLLAALPPEQLPPPIPTPAPR